jgi:hypothetical protein
MALIAAVVGPTLTLMLAWLVGNSLTTRWDAVKKRTELDLAAMEQFYKLYGEFFTVWKLWEDATRRGDETKRSSLLDRIAVAEGQLEALIVRIGCERSLTEQQLHAAGAFRQAYQTLRKSMKHGHSLSGDDGWNASNAAPYAAFKGLAASVAVLLRPAPARLIGRLPAPGPHPIAATAALRSLTSNAYEPWTIDGGQRRLVVWEAVARNQGLLDVPEDWPPPVTDGSPYYNSEAVYAVR